MAEPEKKKDMFDPDMTNEEVMMESLREMAREDAPKCQEGLNIMFDNIFSKGMLPQHAVGMGEVEVEKIYAQAYQLYQTGKYDEARTLFSTLSMLNGLEPKYLFGHAACSHMLGEYALAARTYSHVSLLDADNPVPYYHAADCYLKINDKISALVALRLVVKRSGNKPEFSVIKDRSEMTLKKLEKEDLMEGMENIMEGDAPEVEKE